MSGEIDDRMYENEQMRLGYMMREDGMRRLDGAKAIVIMIKEEGSS